LTIAMVGLGKVESFCQRHWFEARRLHHRRVLRAAAEIKLDVLAGREGLARPGDHQNQGLRIDR
jgi:hypothetical protein